MKKTILALALAATAITGAQALPEYNDGDVFLGIRSKTGSFTYTLDLGTMDQFINAYNGNYNVNLNVGFTAANLAADLSDNTKGFGASWYSSSDVVFGLFGGYQLGSVYSSISGMPDNAMIIGSPVGATLNGNISNQQLVQLGSYAGAISGSIGSSTNSVTVNTAFIAPNTVTGTWADFQYGGNSTTYNNMGSAAYGLYTGSLETQIGNVLNVNAIYSSGDSIRGGVIGGVSVGSDGTVSFTAVPEPSTYFLLGIGSLILLIAFRRKSNA